MVVLLGKQGVRLNQCTWCNDSVWLFSFQKYVCVGFHILLLPVVSGESYTDVKCIRELVCSRPYTAYSSYATLQVSLESTLHKR